MNRSPPVPSASVERSWRWCRRKPAVAGLLALVALVALTGAVAVLHQLKRAVDAEADQRSKAAALTLALKDLDTKAEELKNKADDLEKSNVELAAAKIKADEARIAAEKRKPWPTRGSNKTRRSMPCCNRSSPRSIRVPRSWAGPCCGSNSPGGFSRWPINSTRRPSATP